MHRRKASSLRNKRREAGYNMVMLVIAVTVLSIATAAMLPLWSTQAQREREEELIFRGYQYAEAIRVFQRRFGRYPVRLQELVEVKPRSIRKLYKDPMNPDGEWELIFAGGPGAQVNPNNPNNPNGRQGPNGQRGSGLQRSPGLGGDGRDEGQSATGLKRSRQGAFGGPDKVATGPIFGVRSNAKEPSIKIFQGKEQVSQWEFTAEILSAVAHTPDRPPQVPSANTLGRPFRRGVQPLITFSAQGGQPTLPNTTPNAEDPWNRTNTDATRGLVPQGGGGQQGGQGAAQGGQPSGQQVGEPALPRPVNGRNPFAGRDDG